MSRRRHWGITISRTSPQPDSAAAKPLPPVSTWTWVLLGVTVAFGALLRGLRLSEAPGGYLVFNETFYIESGITNAGKSLFGWFSNPTEFNKPPLYQGLVSFIARLDLPVVEGARMISVIAGLSTIVAVFFIGRLLFNAKTGITAAGLLAVMPGVVLVDHNIQVDPLMVALTVWAVYFYLLATATGKLQHSATGGVLLGIGILTKQPAVLAMTGLAIWETWRSGGLAWLRERRTWYFYLPALAIGSSWYLLMLFTRPSNWLGDMFGDAGLKRETMTGVNWDYWYSTAYESCWMLFPLAATLAVVGLLHSSLRRKSGDKFILVFAIIYFGYHMVVHLHSYYLLPLAPFLALAIARLFTGAVCPYLPCNWIRPALMTVLVLSMSFSSAVMLSGKKWGYWSPIAYTRTPDPGYSQVDISYLPDLKGFFGPGIVRVQDGQGVEVPVRDFLCAPAEEGVQHFFLARTAFDSARGGAPVPAIEPVTEERVRPVAFGYAIGQDRLDDARHLQSTQTFRNQRWIAERVGPLWHFGVHTSPIESGLFLYDKASFMQ